MPGNVFAGSVIDSLRKRSYEPARADGRAVSVLQSARWRFGFQGKDARDLDRINPYLQAQVALGRLAFAEGSEEGMLRAQRWLEPAALSGDSFAVKYYAAALVGPADPARRDARRARRLILPLLQQPLFVNDPAVWQLAAAAHAGAADFPEAVKAQRTALQRARRYGWDLAPLERNLKAYESNTLAAGEFLTLSSTYASAKDDPDRGRACDETPRTGTKLTRCN